MSIGFGFKARIGQLYPSGGLCDYEPQVMAPEGVQFLTTRVPFRKTGLEDDRAFSTHLEEHAMLLADAAVDLIAVNCTAATLVAGAENVNRRVFEATGIPSITTIEAVEGALHQCGMRRIALVTPYRKEVVDEEMRHLAGCGIEVATLDGTPCETPVQQGTLPASHWLETVRAMDLSGVDGVLISCAGIQLAEVLAQIEEVVGLPVITSNQALLWACLGTLGLMAPVRGYGSLLAGAFGSYRR